MNSQPKKQKPEKKLDLELNCGEKPLVPFEVDILATEDFARIHRSCPLSPEHELMAAVLDEAIADYQRCWKARDKKGTEQFADAQAWILESSSDWIFSFVNCCEARAQLLAPGIASLEARKTRETVESPSDTATKASSQTHASGSVNHAMAFDRNSAAENKRKAKQPNVKGEKL